MSNILVNKVHVYRDYNDKGNVIDLSPSYIEESDENGNQVVVATFEKNTLGNDRMFIGESSEISFSLEGQDVIIGNKVIWNKLEDKYYSTFQEAFEKCEEK